MPKGPYPSFVGLVLSVLIPLSSIAGELKPDAAKLTKSYAANEWHMKRFLLEYLSLEQKLVSDPENPELLKRARTLKMQIDLLSRENERILNSLDETGQGNRGFTGTARTRG